MIRFTAVVFATALAIHAQPVAELLWPGGAPRAVGGERADQPRITIYPAPAERNGGSAVVICPGGGYGHLAVTYEGHEVAEWFNRMGMTAAVLEYRIAPRYRHPAPLEDARRAVQLLRSRAAQLRISADRIGIMGFSAGGHLAALAATRPVLTGSSPIDPVDKQTSLVNFLVLAYPVISMGEITHKGSRDNLLGNQQDTALIEEVSPHLHTSASTPPTFIFHTSSDSAVLAENSVLFYESLRKAKVPAELHIFELGPHGVGLGRKDPALSVWPTLLTNWLRIHGLIPAL